jgi:two-component system, response regulator PdtaR
MNFEPAQISSAESPRGRARPRGAPVVSQTSKGEAEAPRVLLVEDDYLMAIDVEAGLTEAGFVVVGVAATAEEAVALAKSERPALAIMDVRLAGIRDGIDAAIDIFLQTGIRCIFATAFHDPDTRARAEASRPIAWLQKPYVSSSLIVVIRTALSQLNISTN